MKRTLLAVCLLAIFAMPAHAEYGLDGATDPNGFLGPLYRWCYKAFVMREVGIGNGIAIGYIVTRTGDGGWRVVPIGTLRRA